MATVMSVGVLAQTPLIDLDASKLSEGPLAAWKNAGSLNGAFSNDGANPQVKVIDGVKAVDFSGKDRMLADFKAPAALTGDKPWTVIIKTNCRELTGERTLISWSNRPDSCLEIGYGEATYFGAIGTWSNNVSDWANNVPVKNKWHTMIYSYAGGADGTFQAWCDGELRVSKKFTPLTTKTDRPFVIGACMTGDPAPGVGYVHNINGAIASIKVIDRAYSTIESWNAYGFNSAILLSPQRGATVDAQTTMLKWEKGIPDATSYAIEVRNQQFRDGDRDRNQRDDNEGGLNIVDKVNKTEYGPLKLDLGTTYYWAVDQLNASGKVAQKGIISEFKTETGNATAPVPADSYIFVEGGKHQLAWTPGKYALKQNIYIGDSAEEVLAKKKPDFANLAASVTSVELPIKNPALGKYYYWRVESINDKGLLAAKGDVWSFRTVSKKLKVYISSGQSNSVGCSMVTGMPEKYKGFNKNCIIFVRGECIPKNEKNESAYGWAYLKDGLGSDFGNRDGKGTFGPELLFGYNMAPQDPKQVMAIIKIAWGGTNLGAQWRPPSAGGTVGDLYTKWVNFFNEAKSTLDPAFEPEFCGMIWMQGESDTGDPKMANEYESNLTNLIKDFRAEIKSPNLPFVHATISKADAWKAYGDVVRAAEEKVAQTVTNTATFATDDYGMCDPWHYDTAGMVSLGERFAAAMKKLEKQ